MFFQTKDIICIENLLEIVILTTRYPGYRSQARSKVHVFKTLFPAYMEKTHPYEEPVPPLPLCAFKFDASKFGVVRDTYEKYRDAIEHFGVFEFDQPPHARRLASSPEDFENKVLHLSVLSIIITTNNPIKLAILNYIYNLFLP